MLTKAAYVVWVSSALKLRKRGKKKVSVPTFQLSHTLFPIWSLYINPALFLPLPPGECFYCYTFLPMAPFGLLGGGGSKILCCCCGGNVEYRGMILISPTSWPRSSISLLIRLQASSISWNTERATINPGAACKEQIKQVPKNTWTDNSCESGRQWKWKWRWRRREVAGENHGSLLQYICSLTIAPSDGGN